MSVSLSQWRLLKERTAIIMASMEWYQPHGNHVLNVFDVIIISGPPLVCVSLFHTQHLSQYLSSVERLSEVDTLESHLNAISV